MFNPFESQKLSLPSSKLILELTVFSQLRLVKIAVRVLLDSVSFSRIIRCPLGLVARADSSIIISQSRPPVNTFFELFLILFEAFSSLLEFYHHPNVIFSCWRKKKHALRCVQAVDKKLFSPPGGGRIALSTNERIAEFLDFSIQAKFVHVNKLKTRLAACFRRFSRF